MKTKIFAISVLTGLSVTTAGLAAGAAGGGGGGGGGGASAAAAGRAVPSANPAQVAPGRIIPPGAQPGNPGGPINSTEGVNGTGTTTMTSNSPAATPTNEFAGTNQFPRNTNLAGNNSNPVNNQLNQAITPGDRTLLTTLQAGVASQLGTAAGAAPVHFMINNGMVTLVGTVPTADQSQRILARVQQTPGVVSVFNDLRVGNAMATTAVQPRDNLTGNVGLTDRAFSPADQTLLTVVEQSAGNQLGITGASAAQMPVHFSIQNGVVAVMGQVSSPQEKAAVLAAVRQTPGVVRVVDNLGLVNVPQNNGISGGSPLLTPPMNQTQPLQPTSRSMGLTNSQFLNTTN